MPMSETGSVAAIDLGATSGRVMIGRIGPDTLALEPVARFPNGPVPLASGLHWDLTGLYRHALEGLRKAAHRDPALASIGIDSWAVDYVLLRGDRMLSEPFHYRDERTVAGVEAVHARHTFADLYRRNGLQFLPFTTLYQLAAEQASGMLDLADAALLIPDALAFELTGRRVAEHTNASTTGLVRIDDGQWDRALCDDLGIPSAILSPLIDPGERIGPLRPMLTEDLGVTAEVVAVGSHDTASAVVAVPMSDPDTSAYISCGTWGLVGLELESPVVTDAAREANFTNERGVDGRIRFLHNVMGLWLLSESVRQWEKETGEAIDLATLLGDAAEVSEPAQVFDANDPRFLAPGDLPARIAQWYRERALPVPTTRAAFTRAIVESLAHAFADAVHTASALTGRRILTLHLVGGGSLNRLLCQRTADRAAIPVLAGPVEATALGNVLVQARAVGLVSGELEDLRYRVVRSHPPRRYDPVPTRRTP